MSFKRRNSAMFYSDSAKANSARSSVNEKKPAKKLEIKLDTKLETKTGAPVSQSVSKLASASTGEAKTAHFAGKTPTVGGAPQLTELQKKSGLGGAPAKTTIPSKNAIGVAPTTKKNRWKWLAVLSPLFWIRVFIATARSLPSFLATSLQIFLFTILLSFFLVNKLGTAIGSIRFFPRKLFYPLTKPFEIVYRLLQRANQQTDAIPRTELIELALRNMRAKGSRTYITVGGMAVGIGSIVFLVSIGYGLQSLVINRVARLDEMLQTDVAVQPGSQVRLNDEALSSFRNLDSVREVLPQIAVVGQITYQNSVTSMPVYGITSEYLRRSAVRTIQGDIFESNSETAKYSVEHEEEQVGPPVFGKKRNDIHFTFEKNTWTRVRETPTTTAPILGFTRRQDNETLAGELFWGDSFEDVHGFGETGTSENGKSLGNWIKADVPLWKEAKCESSEPTCEDGKYLPLLDESGAQKTTSGYFAQLDIVATTRSGEVLGVSTEALDTGPTADENLLALENESFDIQSLLGIDSSENSASVSAKTETADMDILASIASLSASMAESQKTKTVEIGEHAQKEAVVNRAMLQVLGIVENEAVGKTFSASFVVTSDLLGIGEEKIVSLPSEYTIVGVIPEDSSPFFYVPFMDLRSLGIVNFSQVKIVAQSKDALPTVRQNIEALGFNTTSVVDTVQQIERLFATARTVLAAVGLVALAVASLGMFNTLTISLLERTREVGLMKAMGMRSREIRDLFLTESMIMGFFGGLGGIVFGFIAGKTIGAILSAFSLSRGLGILDISYIPSIFVVIVMTLSLLVGILTGIYPARRATKISALNALRYE